MCFVSVITGAMPGQINPDLWTRPTFDTFADIVERLKQLDTSLGLPDCEDPAKATFMKDVEMRLLRAELAQAIEHLQRSNDAYTRAYLAAQRSPDGFYDGKTGPELTTLSSVLSSACFAVANLQVKLSAIGKR